MTKRRRDLTTQRPDRKWGHGHWTALATIIQAGLLLAGAIKGYEQWQQKNVLDLQTQWHSSDMQIHRDRWLDAVVGIDRSVVGTEARNLFVQEVANRDLPAMLDFFSEVHLCLSSKLCDNTAACAAFANDAHNLDEFFGESINEIRLKIPDRSWGSDSYNVENDCAQYLKEHASNNARSAITRNNMTEEEKSTYKKMILELDKERGLAYDIVSQACERIADGGRARSGCAFQASHWVAWPTGTTRRKAKIVNN